MIKCKNDIIKKTWVESWKKMSEPGFLRFMELLNLNQENQFNPINPGSDN